VTNELLARASAARVIAAWESERARMLAEGLTPPEYDDSVEDLRRAWAERRARRE
jgi:hypothetical protein